ncbi:putative potassium transport system protein kup [Bacteroidia bacterium]|nr:putative potassium transport system protein kup [Bacteroidia bacterium]GHT62614.1 putative potassium transport system protein kup [Bacteroidia bacterium]
MLGKNNNVSRFTWIGTLVTIGIVFGDIGTSPLYVMKAIVSAQHGLPNQYTIIGALSCIIWTLTLQTTLKYVMIALKADNKGEGGILALYSLVQKMNKKWLYLIAILGAAALVSDGVITPSMTIISAIEGLQVYNPNVNVIHITIFILLVLFSVQQFGTHSIGKYWGPVMVLWFLMLAAFGILHILPHLYIFKAFNPYYAIHFLIQEPNTLVILGAVFLCTTGAEALYSDLGHCGIHNIRISWIFVKICLILNYLGQGAWILSYPEEASRGGNPFFLLMPSALLVPGIIMSTLAAVIASQALITGSYTIFSEAMSLSFWPRQRVEYPTQEKGQMYIRVVNWGLFICCVIVVLYFQSSSKMEAAYGLAITITMMMTTFLLIFYLLLKKVNLFLIALFGLVYFIIESGFFYANILKFAEGGWITIMLAGAIAFCMYVWYSGRKLKNKYVQYVKIKPYLPVIEDMRNDESIPKYATNLAYISRAKKNSEIESKIIYSMINKNPKRADHYWFLKLQNDPNPYTFEYEFTEMISGILFKVKFKLGYKIEPLISVYFGQVLEDLQASGRFDSLSNYPSLRKYDVQADFKFIIIDRVFTQDYLLSSVRERYILRFYNFVKRFGITDRAAFGLESYNVDVEEVPMLTGMEYKNRIKRAEV